MDRLKDAETDELRELVTKVITLRGHRKENLVSDWIACEALQIVDPHRQAPPFVRRRRWSCCATWPRRKRARTGRRPTR